MGGFFPPLCETRHQNQCIRLLSFCKKHSPNPSNDRTVPDERIGQLSSQGADYSPPVNPSGCARSEPYDYFGRRGRKEPEVLAAASLKRAYVENRPYLVGGFSHHDESSSKLQNSDSVASTSVFSMSEKYIYMTTTFRKRLAFDSFQLTNNSHAIAVSKVAEV